MVVAFLLVVASFRVTLEKLVKFRLSAVGDLPVDLQIVLGQPEIENTEIIVKVVIVYRKIERAVQRNTEIVILYNG